MNEPAAGLRGADAVVLILYIGFIAYLVLRIARRPARGAMTYGLGRAEILSAQVNGVTLAVLAALIVRNRDARRAEHDAGRIAGLIEEAGEGKVLILGPAAAPIGRLRGEFRHQILVKGVKRGRIRAVLNAVLGRLPDFRIHPRNLVIDVDPLSTM